MTDHVPTTEEVRAVIATSYDRAICAGEIPAQEKANGLAAFNRWLDHIRAEAWEQGFEDAHAAHHRENVRLNRRSPAIAIINPYREQEET